MIQRRKVLAGLALGAAWPAAAALAGPSYPVVSAGAGLRFPADHGAHPDFRTEWWYVTGWLRTATDRHLGFQITFFRTRPDVAEDNPSAFAPTQILFAHAALSDPEFGRLRHDQRAARVGFGLAQAATGDTDITLDGWTLKRDTAGRFDTHVIADGFAIDLSLTPTQPILVQGEDGYSRKGPDPTRASYYFSLPHLRVAGAVTEAGESETVAGEAWLDREWSSTLLDPEAVGWDWLGVNLDDGSALMAFQIRAADGRAIWAGGALRSPTDGLRRLAPGDVSFATERIWHSTRTGADYPVERTVTIRLGSETRHWRVTPFFDDQELDSRRLGGPVYWEGAVRVDGAGDGKGYLELTGYLDPLKM